MEQKNQPIRQVQGGPRKRLHLLIVKQMLALAASGFGLVAALAWNNVIQEFVSTHIKPYLPFGSGLISLVIYAVIVTVIAVTVTYQLTKLIDKLEGKS
jgi:cytochrome b subunit of formate dehydrogenase